MYYVYIVRCDDNSLYTGITADIDRRMREHVLKEKEAAAYTKSRNVVSLEALWSAENRSMASKLEYIIKRYPKVKKESLIADPNVFEEYPVLEIVDKYFRKIK
ncbi:MAG: GIY-YIG nuclease family protein [Erysipelothrix sp.]|nr:GIY-YIG nuclease family protein [Erysipelothrix sp.]